MNNFKHSLVRALACAGLTLASLHAAAVETVVQSKDYGLVAVPYTQSFGLSVAPAASSTDTFLSDYGFSIGDNSSFSSAVVTFDLGSVLSLTNVTITLLSGSAWAGPVPTTLTPAEVADINSRILASGTGSAMNKVIDDMTLSAGSYVVEVSGNVTGTAGGSFAGVLNVAAVPEPAGLALALAGFGLLALRRRVAR